MRKIVVDTFGADASDKVIIKGCLDALDKYTEFGAVIIGNKGSFVEQTKSTAPDIIKRIEFIESRDAISNDDPPTCIFNGRNDSSMAMMLDRLKSDDECFAGLSSGNTGALFVGSMCRLGLKKGVKAPVLSAAIPTIGDKWVCLLDCGASLSCSKNDLLKFALLGCEFARLAFGVKNPRVGLLSVGTEKGKGTLLVNEAYELLENSELNFIGNIESFDILSDKAEVIVTDGFSGNILLKNIEATGKAAMQAVKRLKTQHKEDKDNADALYDEILNRLSEKFDLNSRGGATFLGTVKPLIKMHGCANAYTVTACIDQLVRVETQSRLNDEN